MEALAGGADVVITGRIGDPAMFLGPLVHEFGWAMDDWDALGRGTAVGPPARMRRTGDGRVLRRSRLQGCRRFGPARLSDRLR